MNSADSSPMQPGSITGKARMLTLDDLDGRTLAARRARMLVEDIESDLGGPKNISAAMRELVVRAAVLGALLQDGEARLLAGEKVDFAQHLAAINSQRRVLTTLGLDRRTRDVTPNLGDYLQAKRA
jgi:hypothetical protein